VPQVPQEHLMQMAAPAPSAMGYTQVPQHDWVSLKVKEERYKDLDDKLKKLEQELLDCKSDLRIEKEKRSTAELKLNTISEKKDFEKERALADKESAFDKLANNEALVSGLGAALGKLPEVFSQMKQTPGAVGMGNPLQGYSKEKQDFIKDLKEAPDGVIPLVNNTLWAILNIDEFAASLQESLTEVIPNQE
jgi:hypothetical protein